LCIDPTPKEYLILFRTHRFLALLPDPGCALAASGLTAQRVEQLGLRIIREESYLLAVDETHSQSEHRTYPDQQASFFVVDTFPGVPALPTLGIHATLATMDLYSALDEHVQFFQLMEAGPQSLRIWSDRIGTKAYYYARLPNAYLVASRLSDIFTLYPDFRKPLSPLGLLETFVFDAPVGNRTLHANIYRPRSGESISWSESEGWSIRRENRFPLPAVNPQIDTSSTVDLIFNLYRTKIRARLALSSRPPLLPMSGGYDSRLLACVLASVTDQADSFTLCLPEHDEYHVARRVAKSLGFPHELLSGRIPYENNIAASLAHHEGQVGTGTTYVANFPAIEADRHRMYLSGACAGTVAGEHLKWAPWENCGSLDEAADAIFRSNTKSLAGDLPQRLGISANFDDLRNAIREDLSEEGFPYQAVMLWDFENRQRRHIFPQVAYTANHFHVHCPHFHREIMTAWFSMPRPLLDFKYLVRCVIQAKYPQVASLPHSDTNELLVPKNWHALTYLARQLGRRLRQRATRIARLSRKGPNTDAWNWWLGTTPQMAAYERERLATGRDVLTQVLGYTLPGFEDEDLRSFAKDSWRAELVLRRAMLLTEYARWLRS